MKRKPKKHKRRTFHRKNPVRKLPHVKRGRRDQARKLAALRSQLRRKGVLIPTRAQFDLRALRAMRKNPGKRTRKRRKPSRQRTAGRVHRYLRRVFSNPDLYYIAARVPTAKGNKLGFHTGSDFDDNPARAKGYASKSEAVSIAQKLANNWEVTCTVFTGNARLHSIAKKLKL